MNYAILALAGAISLAPAYVLATDVPSTGDSSVFLTIWNDGFSQPTPGTGAGDNGNNRTLVVDTGLNFSDLIYNVGDPVLGPYTIDIDAAVAAASSYTSAADIFDNNFTGDMYMQVVAFDGLSTAGSIPSDYAVMTSYNGSMPESSNVALSNSIIKADAFYGFLGSNDVVVGTTENGELTFDDSWGNNFGGSWSAINNAVAFDASDADEASELTLNMAFVRTGGNGGNGENLDVNTFANPYTAAFNFATGDLVITTAAVPVPAAVWLFGSAIAGLIGFSRRNNEIAAS